LQGRVIFVEEFAEDFYYEFVVGALGEAGDGDTADDAGALNSERE
jgi:hypothetical protein